MFSVAAKGAGDIIHVVATSILSINSTNRPPIDHPLLEPAHTHTYVHTRASAIIQVPHRNYI